MILSEYVGLEDVEQKAVELLCAHLPAEITASNAAKTPQIPTVHDKDIQARTDDRIPPQDFPSIFVSAERVANLGGVGADVGSAELRLKVWLWIMPRRVYPGGHLPTDGAKREAAALARCVAKVLGERLRGQAQTYFHQLLTERALVGGGAEQKFEKRELIFRVWQYTKDEFGA